MKNTRETAEYLLKAIYQYYPIGVPAFKSSYWQANIKKIVEDKINGIINQVKSPWDDITTYLKENFPDKVLDMNYMQFPCHQAWVEIEKEQTSRYEFIRKAVLNISLLCPYYTLYFEDRITFNYFGMEYPPNMRILFSKESSIKQDIPFPVDEIKSKVVKLFREHSFVPHKILFDYKISAQSPDPQSYDPIAIDYPFYNFLFDANFSLENLQVLK